MDRTYPSLLERGRRTPTLGMLIALAHALGVEPTLLVAMTVTRLGRGGTHNPPDSVPIGNFIEDPSINAGPVNAKEKAKDCDRMAIEVQRWSRETSDSELQGLRRQLAKVLRTAARAWRRKDLP
jgi:transcriptional regulator with XRE-family HTH domain